MQNFFGSWWINAMSGKRTTIGGILVAILPSLLAAEQAGVHIPENLKLYGFIASGVGSVLLGSQARQGNVSSEQVRMEAAKRR